MSDGRIEANSTGELMLAGVLDYQTGPALRQEGQRLIRESDGNPLRVDCSGVTRSSSVGLSLLLAFMRDARASGRDVRIDGLPKDMYEIAKVSGLLDVLPLASATEAVAR